MNSPRSNNTMKSPSNDRMVEPIVHSTSSIQQQHYHHHHQQEEYYPHSVQQQEINMVAIPIENVTLPTTTTSPSIISTNPSYNTIQSLDERSLKLELALQAGNHPYQIRPLAQDGLHMITTIRKQIPRPPNAFFVFRAEIRPQVSNEYPDYNSAELSKVIGERWRNMTDIEKEVYAEKAKNLRDQHKELFPNYKYKPRRQKRNKNASLKKVKKMIEKSEQSIGSPVLSQCHENHVVIHHPHLSSSPTSPHYHESSSRLINNNSNNGLMVSEFKPVSTSISHYVPTTSSPSIIANSNLSAIVPAKRHHNYSPRIVTSNLSIDCLTQAEPRKKHHATIRHENSPIMITATAAGASTTGATHSTLPSSTIMATTNTLAPFTQHGILVLDHPAHQDSYRQVMASSNSYIQPMSNNNTNNNNSSLVTIIQPPSHYPSPPQHHHQQHTIVYEKPQHHVFKNEDSNSWNSQQQKTISPATNNAVPNSRTNFLFVQTIPSSQVSYSNTFHHQSPSSSPPINNSSSQEFQKPKPNSYEHTQPPNGSTIRYGFQSSSQSEAIPTTASSTSTTTTAGSHSQQNHSIQSGSHMIPVYNSENPARPPPTTYFSGWTSQQQQHQQQASSRQDSSSQQNSVYHHHSHSTH